MVAKYLRSFKARVTCTNILLYKWKHISYMYMAINIVVAP